MTAGQSFKDGELPGLRLRSRLPRLRAVLVEQARTLGFVLRWPIIVAAASALLATLGLAIQVARGDIVESFHAQPSALPAVIGLLLPIAVWAREERFGPGFLWTLPVDRRQHALIKVLAGWLWLMGGVALFTLCLLVLALISGTVLPVETLHVLTTGRMPRSAPLDPSALRIVQWAPGALIWAVPFGAATAAYLFGSALMLGTRHPFRWVIGGALGLPAIGVACHTVGRLLGLAWLADAPERAMVLLIASRFGLDSLIKLRTGMLDQRVRLPDGEQLHVWTAVPSLSDWGIAALLWIGVGMFALWAAVSRHRERRRS